jgi:TadE-like protein
MSSTNLNADMTSVNSQSPVNTVFFGSPSMIRAGAHSLRHRRKAVKGCVSGATRRGAALIELAVSLPVVTLLVFCSLSGANMIFLRNAACQASYEGVKASVNVRGSKAEGIKHAEQVLAGRNIKNATFKFNPNLPENAARGKPVSLTITIPAQGNTIFAFGPFKDRDVTVEAVMVKE